MQLTPVWVFEIIAETKATVGDFQRIATISLTNPEEGLNKLINSLARTVKLLPYLKN